ncbi:GNAT family N-acetyltransferase [Arsenicicoccus dermatophilus]|uniref:GNAT family N-acetyltransferase n=1 Tax=Arsenicicoccus dermatophilus TaxID=1076331 RepID=UPI00391758EA
MPSVELRSLTVDDATTLASWAADEHFCRVAGWTLGRSVAEHRATFCRRLESAPDLIRLGATHDGELVGYVDLHGEEPGRRELGYLVGPRARWGQGLGLAVARAGLRHGFEVLGLRTIWAEAVDANVPSVRILQRLGMTETGWGDAATHLDRPTRYRRFEITVEEYDRG